MCLQKFKIIFWCKPNKLENIHLSSSTNPTKDQNQKMNSSYYWCIVVESSCIRYTSQSTETLHPFEFLCCYALCYLSILSVAFQVQTSLNMQVVALKRRFTFGDIRGVPIWCIFDKFLDNNEVLWHRCVHCWVFAFRGICWE